MTAPENGNLKDIVFGAQSAEDDDCLQVLVDQYKLFVDTSERLVARRQVVNTFFLSVNALALSAVGIIAKEATESPLAATGIVAISIAAVALCVAWKRLVRSYAQLNRGKFEVIECLEDRLPAAVFRAEWAALKEGNDPSVYRPFTHTEAAVSSIFVAIHTLAAVLTVAMLSCS